MKRLVLLLFSQIIFAQVGINTTIPNATLEIKIANEANPSNTDGIIIPKIDQFPLVNPTANQQGMMVYLKNDVGSNLAGFYYWDNFSTTWKSITTKPDVDFLTVATNQTPMNITDNKYTLGNNGFGISTPLFPLHVRGRAALGQNSDTAGQLTFFPSTGAAWWHLQNDNNGLFSISHGGTPGAFNIMTWDFNGRVGIGTTAPSDALHILGNIRMVDGNQAAGKVLTSDVNGRATWENPNLAGAWLTSGNAINASNFIGSVNDVNLTFRRNNIFAGFVSNITAKNTSFGIATNQNGLENTAFGYNALATNVGENNVAIGDDALYSNITGNQNTALGSGALRLNISGRNNTALGSSLNSNTSGSQNIAVGDLSLSQNTVWVNNVAVGFMSLQNLSVGERNTAIGNFSAQNATSGDRNVFVGYASGRSSIGSDNVLLGNSAGQFLNGSNRLYIENTSSNLPLIYGEFDNDLLRVNGELRLNRVATLNNEAVVKNDSRFAHSSDANLNFGSVGGNEFMLASRETVNETGGVRGDGDNISIWSPGDFGRLVRFLDEDFWIDNNSNPYDNGAERAYIDQNGQYFQVSDKNKKSNIKLITSALDKISNISGYTYTYKINKETEAKGEKPKKAIGLLAQELQKSIPEAVEENDSNELFVNYSALIGVLVQANKELLEKVNTLQTRIENLEKK